MRMTYAILGLGLVLATCGTTHAAISDGLIMYTPMDTVTTDQVGASDDPIMANISLTGGKFSGFAYQGAGGLGFPTIKGAASFGSSFSATAWIRPSLTNTVVLGNGATNAQGWTISAANNGNLYVRVSDGVSAQTGNLPFDYTNNPWIFASFVYDQGAQTATFRIQNGYSGALVTHSFTLDASASLVSTGGYYWSAGALYHNSVTNDTRGIDDIAFWGRALAADEIGQIFNNGDGATIGSLLAVPEPATMSLLAIGGLAALIRRKRS
ncbi:MAG: PEP-CTERM sorting domain-containing protein [Planctomycetaceae bacterium]|nr:PEP-CTERM sorting domain-containing protein [Planctomycetaceae bacterium]